MIYYFTYGDDKYRNSKYRLHQEAVNSKLFDNITIFGREDISAEFHMKTQPYISMSRGGGFWLWKPFFLKQMMDKAQEGDYIVYTDAGCAINHDGSVRFNEYLKMLDSNESGVLAFELTGLCERAWTNAKVIEHFGFSDDEDFKNTSQLMATIFIIKKCAKSQRIVEEYYDMALNNPILFSDHYNDYNRDPMFNDNRHDQSIWSIIRKMNNVLIIQDETWAENMDGWNKIYYEKKIPFLASRIRG